MICKISVHSLQRCIDKLQQFNPCKILSYLFEQVVKCSFPSAKEKTSQSGYSFSWKIENYQTLSTAALIGNRKSLNILKHGWVLPPYSVLCVETFPFSQQKYHKLKVQEKKKSLDAYAVVIHLSKIGQKIILFGILMKLILQNGVLSKVNNKLFSLSYFH